MNISAIVSNLITRVNAVADGTRNILFDNTGVSLNSTSLKDAIVETNRKHFLKNKASFIANGHTAEPKEYIETNTPYTMIDPSTDSLVVDGNVVEVLGDELVLDRELNDATKWTIGNNWSVLNGKATLEAGEAWVQLLGEITLPSTSHYRIEFTISNSNGAIEAKLLGSLGYFGNGTHIRYLEKSAGTTSIYFQPTSTTTSCNIDNISVKEIKPIVLLNAPFDAASTDEVISGLGAELMTSAGNWIGDFDVQADVDVWVLSGGGVATLSSGAMRITNSAADFGGASYATTVEIGKKYKVNLDRVGGTGTGLWHIGDGVTYNQYLGNYNGSTFIFTATATTVKIALTAGGNVLNDYFEYDNISVREVESQLSCKESHSKGDIVVTGNELKNLRITDGNTTFTVADDVITGNGTQSYKSVNLATGVLGETFIVDYEVTSYTSGKLSRWDGSWIETEFTEAVGRRTVLITLTNTSNIDIGTSDISFIGSVTIHSVRLKDDVKQATVDTADMYDYEHTGVSNTVPLTANETVIYVNDGNDTAGLNGHFYLATWTSAGADLSTLDFSNTGAYIDLGTATTMSLLNPYFQTLDRVARQDVVVHRVNKTTLAYDKHSFKGTHLFEDTASSIDVMNHYYGSPDAKGLWSDTTYYYLPLDIFQRLNSGAYHPWFNEFGSARVLRTTDYNGLKYWHEADSVEVINSYKAFVFGEFLDSTATVVNGQGAIGTTGGRPNSEFYDKVYINQSRDLRLKAYKEDTTTLLRDTASKIESGRLDGVEGVVQMIPLICTTGATAGTVTFADCLTESYGFTGAEALGNDTQLYNITKGEFISYINMYIGGNGITITTATVSLNDLCIVANGFKGLASPVSQALKSQYSFRGNFTYTDLIGSPANYPQTLKDRLAAGKSVLINPKLVNQDGTSAIPVDETTGSFIAEKKVLGDVNIVRRNDNLTTYATTTLSSNIDNTIAYNFIDYDLYLCQYQAKTKATNQLPIGATVAALDKVYASNSHSIYKGGNAVASGTGLIPTGNGSNGYESKYLENLETYISVTNKLLLGVAFDYKVGDVFIAGEGFTNFIEGNYYEVITALAGTPTSGYSNTWTRLLGSFPSISTPQHNTINLDNSDSKASKRFYTLEEDENGLLQEVMYTTEMKWDFLNDSSSEGATTITDGVTALTYTVGTKYWLNNSAFGYFNRLTFTMLVEYTGSAGSFETDFKLMYLDGRYYLVKDGKTKIAEVWDGNGFGDSNLFEQLTNGTITDDNGNIVKTSRTAIPLNSFTGSN